ncbi:hypothetical protein [Persephonella sp.]
MINIKPFNFNYEFITIAKPQGKSITLKAGETVRAEVVDILPSGGVVLRMKGGHITVNTEIPLQKDTSLLLKILNTPQTDHKLKIQIVAVLNKEGNLTINPRSEIMLNQLTSLFGEKSVNLEVLKSITDLLSLNINNLNKDIKNVLVNLFTKGISENRSILFQNITKIPSENIAFINNLTPDKLQFLILNSGIFLENKLRNKKSVDSDLKFKILKGLSEGSDGNLKDILRLIEDYQVVSKLSDGLFTFLPLIWDNFNGGDIFVKERSNQKSGKKSFLCVIDLNFSDLGDIQVSFLFDRRDLFVSFFIENSDFEDFIKREVNELRENLEKVFSNVFIKFNKKKEKTVVMEENFIHLKV